MVCVLLLADGNKGSTDDGVSRQELTQLSVVNPNPIMMCCCCGAGRPVDVLVLPDGSLLVSDDQAGTVYQIKYNSGLTTSSIG